MKTCAVILAAGKGTRFGESNVNKTAVTVNGEALIKLGINNIKNLVDKCFVVVGHKKETVMEAVGDGSVVYVEQKELLGTGHAVKVALEAIEKSGEVFENVLVANGDHLFMIDPKVLKDLLDTHISNKNGVTILTASSQNPVNSDNGRINRVDGGVVAIIEKKDFTDEIRRMSELNTGTYVFNYEAIKTALNKTELVPNQELYITNVLFNVSRIGTSTADIEKVGIGVNTRQELSDYLASL